MKTICVLLLSLLAIGAMSSCQMAPHNSGYMARTVPTGEAVLPSKHVMPVSKPEIEAPVMVATPEEVNPTVAMQSSGGFPMIGESRIDQSMILEFDH